MLFNLGVAVRGAAVLQEVISVAFTTAYRIKSIILHEQWYTRQQVRANENSDTGTDGLEPSDRELPDSITFRGSVRRNES